MMHENLAALITRIEALPDTPSPMELVALLADAGGIIDVMVSAMEPFARVVYNGTPSDCGGLLTQSDWERLAQLFAPPPKGGPQ